MHTYCLGFFKEENTLTPTLKLLQRRLHSGFHTFGLWCSSPWDPGTGTLGRSYRKKMEWHVHGCVLLRQRTRSCYRVSGGQPHPQHVGGSRRTSQLISQPFRQELGRGVVAGILDWWRNPFSAHHPLAGLPPRVS